LADCATTAKPHVVPPPPPPPRAPEPSPPPPPPAAHGPIQAHWIFSGGGACTATVATALVALDVVASPTDIAVSVRLNGHHGLPRKGTLIDFAGESGNWSVTAHGPSRHKATASEPMSEDAAGRVLVLLSGGVVHFGEPRDGLPALRVPNGGAPARLWFECVRHDLQR
jgi:hypothetical protein